MHSYTESLESSMAILLSYLSATRYSSLSQFNILEADRGKELEEANQYSIEDEIIHDILA